MTSHSSAVQTFVKNLSSKAQQSKYLNLMSLGLEDCSNQSGTQKVLVGNPPELPDVVVKVAKHSDVCVLFLYAVYTGVIESKHYPVVYSFTKIKEFYVICMERCTGKPKTISFIECISHLSEITDQEHGLDASLFSALCQIRDLMDHLLVDSGYECLWDLHLANYLPRSLEDDTIVVFDPIWDRRTVPTDIDVIDTFWDEEFTKTKKP